MEVEKVEKFAMYTGIHVNSDCPKSVVNLLIIPIYLLINSLDFLSQLPVLQRTPSLCVITRLF